VSYSYTDGVDYDSKEMRLEIMAFRLGLHGASIESVLTRLDEMLEAAYDKGREGREDETRYGYYGQGCCYPLVCDCWVCR
jgi:hypothetical protein